MNEQKELLTTAQKALTINLDQAKYGTFAEIGAGQEVARWFFHAGKAAGTIAKTISAYDMAISDGIYGPTQHYCSRQRLEAMLDHEFTRLVERLDQTRGERTAFFAFADTSATQTRSQRAAGHSWLGVRFQTEPRGEDVYKRQALRLARYFGTTPQFWINLQSNYDLEVAQDAWGSEISGRVRPHRAA